MIIFEKLTLRNFLSVGNQPVVIELNKNKTTLIHGENGTGKSLILDALTYSLYGKSFRGINLAQLVNTQNDKDMLVEINFSISKDKYFVRRGHKPKLFEIYKNDQLIDPKAAEKDNQQHLEQTILKLGYRSFTQIVILGSSSYVPFMQLPAAGRRDCVEEFLDIKVFTTMSVIAKERLKGLKSNYDAIGNEIKNIDYKINIQNEIIKEAEEETDTRIVELNQKIDDASSLQIKENDKIFRKDAQIIGINREIKELLKKNPEKKVSELSTLLTKFKVKFNTSESTIKFYSENDQCYECKQHIDTNLKKENIDKATQDIKTFSDAITDLNTIITDHQSDLASANIKLNEVLVLNNEISLCKSQIQFQERLISQYVTDIERIANNSTSIDREKGKLEVFETELSSKKENLTKLEQEIKEHEAVVALLKDSGIKSQIVNKYIPIMNKIISEYLTALDFPIQFQLDSEFKETIKSPLHQNYTYSCFSEGQKSRIDLALMFTWREIGKLKNSASCNLLILDEVFSSSLDEVGKEHLMVLLKYKLENINVLVVDHTLNPEFKEKFEKSIEVTRPKGFSQYV